MLSIVLIEIWYYQVDRQKAWCGTYFTGPPSLPESKQNLQMSLLAGEALYCINYTVSHSTRVKSYFLPKVKILNQHAELCQTCRSHVTGGKALFKVHYNTWFSRPVQSSRISSHMFDQKSGLNKDAEFFKTCRSRRSGPVPGSNSHCTCHISTSPTLEL